MEHLRQIGVHMRLSEWFQRDEFKNREREFKPRSSDSLTLKQNNIKEVIHKV